MSYCQQKNWTGKEKLNQTFWNVCQDSDSKSIRKIVKCHILQIFLHENAFEWQWFWLNWFVRGLAGCAKDSILVISKRNIQTKQSKTIKYIQEEVTETENFSDSISL